MHRFDGGFVVDLQSSLLDRLDTRVVAPLIPVDEAGPRIPRLHPIVDIAGRPHLLATQLMSAVSGAGLGEVVVTLESRYYEVKAAIDFVFDGV
ncbi:MAG: plasmid maintenance protein CcdB [Deinococcus-Thermus bacterium]|nr:plasmid maintenance protein CcdB [Deinococcota bacterium]